MSKGSRGKRKDGRRRDEEKVAGKKQQGRKRDEKMWGSDREKTWRNIGDRGRKRRKWGELIILPQSPHGKEVAQDEWQNTGDAAAHFHISKKKVNVPFNHDHPTWGMPENQKFLRWYPSIKTSCTTVTKAIPNQPPLPVCFPGITRGSHVPRCSYINLIVITITWLILPSDSTLVCQLSLLIQQNKKKPSNNFQFSV